MCRFWNAPIRIACLDRQKQKNPLLYETLDGPPPARDSQVPLDQAASLAEPAEAKHGDILSKRVKALSKAGCGVGAASSLWSSSVPVRPSLSTSSKSLPTSQMVEESML